MPRYILDPQHTYGGRISGKSKSEIGLAPNLGHTVPTSRLRKRGNRHIVCAFLERDEALKPFSQNSILFKAGGIFLDCDRCARGST